MLAVTGKIEAISTREYLLTTHHLSCKGCMVQYDTWEKESFETVAARTNAGGFVVAVLERRNGIVSLHGTWVNEIEGLVRPLFL